MDPHTHTLKCSLPLSHLYNSHGEYDADLEEGPPEHSCVAALDSVPVTRLSGLEEVLMGSDFVQLVSYGVQPFL